VPGSCEHSRGKRPGGNPFHSLAVASNLEAEPYQSGNIHMNPEHAK
jgi:hypothetical protein